MIYKIIFLVFKTDNVNVKEGESSMFETFGNDINFKHLIQLDGAFSISHIYYGESPKFYGVDARNIAILSRRNKYSSKEKIENVIDNQFVFDGTEKNYCETDIREMWEYFWKEYISVFDQLIKAKPYSIITIYIGRHTIELGFKFLLLCKSGKIKHTHDLGELAKLLFTELDLNCDKYTYMKYVDDFCIFYSKYIEGGNSEYFRYPEYKGKSYFAGNRLDIKWLSYNISLVILKLMKLAEDKGYLK